MAIVNRNGNYYVTIRLNGRQIWRAAGKRKRDAVALEAELKSSVAKAEFREIKRTMFRDFVEVWRKDSAHFLQPSTRDEYECYLRKHLIPYFGQVQVRQITAHMIQRYITMKLSTGLSNKSVRNHLACLGSLLRKAVAWDYLAVNPMPNVERPKREQRPAAFLSATDVRSLLAASEEPWRTLILTAVMTGMRQGELLGLAWSCVDFEANLIHVRQSLYRGEPKEPKTRSSVRTIPMSPQLSAALLARKVDAPASAMDLVFTRPDGTPLSKKSCGTALKKALQKAGLGKIGYHALRHTFTSVLISMGESPKVVQELLGHSNSAITMDIYAHAFEETKVRAVESLEGLILD